MYTVYNIEYSAYFKTLFVIITCFKITNIYKKSHTLIDTPSKQAISFLQHIALTLELIGNGLIFGHA